MAINNDDFERLNVQVWICSETKVGKKGLIYTIIIGIKRDRQCKAEREWYTPYQSEDPTIPTYWPKEEKGKNSRRLQ